MAGRALSRAECSGKRRVTSGPAQSGGWPAPPAGCGQAQARWGQRSNPAEHEAFQSVIHYTLPHLWQWGRDRLWWWDGWGRDEEQGGGGHGHRDAQGALVCRHRLGGRGCQDDQIVRKGLCARAVRKVDNDRGREAGRRRGGAHIEAGGGRGLRLVCIDRVRSQAVTGCINRYVHIMSRNHCAYFVLRSEDRLPAPGCHLMWAGWCPPPGSSHRAGEWAGTRLCWPGGAAEGAGTPRAGSHEAGADPGSVAMYRVSREFICFRDRYRGSLSFAPAQLLIFLDENLMSKVNSIPSKSSIDPKDISAHPWGHNDIFRDV